MALEHGNVRLATGPRLHFVDQGDAHGDAVVFLHGWPDSWFTYSRVLPLLPPTVRALAVDQRGFGDSDHPESGYSIVDLAADAVAFLDALDIERAAFVGHSYGSFVARRLALDRPDRVTRLVLIGTGFTQASPAIDGLKTALLDLPDPIPVEFAREFQASTAYRPLPPEFFDRIVEESLKIPARLWRPMIDRLAEYDDADELRRLAAPTLLLWGERDALFSREDQDRFRAAQPRARLEIYEETGHCPNWERPVEVAADIVAFLESPG